MIRVAGFNTSFDRYLELDTLQVGEVQRGKRVEVNPGGKGLHVAVLCSAFSEPVKLVGITDARHRELIAKFLRSRDVTFEAVEVSGDVRTCLAIRETDGVITELLEPGPELKASECDQLVSAMTSEIDSNDIAVLSGSLPGGFEPAAYVEILTRLKKIGIRTCVDASGDLLKDLLKHRPYLVKLNRDEASATLGRKICTVTDAVEAARSVMQPDIACVVISLGSEGLVALHEEHIWHFSTPNEESRNAVGAGDCLLGGIVVALARDATMENALKLGTACGATKVRSSETGFLRIEEVESILPTVSMQTLD